MTTLKKWSLVVVGVLVSILIGVVGGLVWARRRVIIKPSPTDKIKPDNFVKSLKAKKEEIDAKIKRMDTDELIDDINSNYK